VLRPACLRAGDDLTAAYGSLPVRRGFLKCIAESQFDAARQIPLRYRHDAEYFRRGAGIRRTENRRIGDIKRRDFELEPVSFPDFETADQCHVGLRRRMRADGGTAHLGSAQCVGRPDHPNRRRRIEPVIQGLAA
jgi:hypothetical protein